MTRNAASKCNNKYLSASIYRVCGRIMLISLAFTMKYRARDRKESRNILCLGSRWNCVQLC